MSQLTTVAILAFALLPVWEGTSFAASPPTGLDLEAVLEGVIKRAEKEAENERLFKQNYTYTRVRLTEERNTKGELKERREKSRTYVPKPEASPDEAGRDSAASKRKFNRNEFPVTREFLERFEFKLVERDTVNGRPVVILDFEPAEKQRPVRNIKERLISKAAGRIWVDETDFALAKADIRLTESVDVVGGLVGAIRRFTYQFERERTLEGLWYTRTVNWHLDLRQVLVRKVVDYSEQNSDVRRVD